MPAEPTAAGADATAQQYNDILDDLRAGWIRAFTSAYGLQTWTYVSASTFKTAGDYRTYFPKGTRIKLTQTSEKYFNVSADPTYIGGGTDETTITITGGSDYTLANAAITDPYYSQMLRPLGFPFWFNYVPSWGGFSADPSGVVAKFAVVGNLCYIRIHLGGMGASNATTLTFTLPIAALLVQHGIPGGTSHNNSTTEPRIGVINVSAASATAQAYPTGEQGTWSASGNKGIFPNFFYQF